LVTCLLWAAPAFAQHTDETGRSHSSDFLPAITTMPRGIPTPDFGMISASPLVEATHCPNWPGSASTNCYYVDRTHGSATDTANTNGYPNQPRLTIPTSLSTIGTAFLVKVAGSGYSISSSPTWTYTGTSDAPIYIVGDGTFPDFDGGASKRTITLSGAYTALIGLEWVNVGFSFGTNASHVAISYNHFYGNTGSGGSTIGWGTDTTDTVVYRNYGHDNGPTIPLVSEADNHFAKPSTSATNTTRLWYLANHVHDNSGDGFQCGSDPADADVAGWPSFIYLGGNVLHHNGENAIDIKACKDVIISENDMYDYRDSYAPGDPGACLVVHGLDSTPVGSDPDSGTGALRTWVIFNRMHDCRIGIASTGQKDLRVLGNLFYGITVDSDQLGTYTYTAGSNTGGSAMHSRANATSPVFQHNTVYNSNNGFNCETSQTCVIRDNIFAVATGASAALGWESTSNGSSVVSNNLVSYGGNGMQFGNFATTYHATLSAFNAAGGSTVDCSNCVEDNPAFTNAAAGTFTIGAASPANDAGSDVTTYYDEFTTLYGLSIYTDMAGTSRSGAASIGAYEETPASGVIRLRIRGGDQ